MTSPAQVYLQTEGDLNSLEFLFTTTRVVELKSVLAEGKERVVANRELLKDCVRDHYEDFLKVADGLSELSQLSLGLSPTPPTPHSALMALDTKLDRTLELEYSNGDPHAVTEDTALFSIASKVKLLVDAPEQIWSALESSQYLLAGQLCCLAEKLYTSLIEATLPLTGIAVVVAFPIIKTQWDILRNARSSVATRASQRLRVSTLPDQVTFDTLLAISLVDQPEPSELVRRFLEERTRGHLTTFTKLPKQVEREGILKRFRDLVTEINRTVRDIAKFFITHGDSFFDLSSSTGLREGFGVESTGNLVTPGITNPTDAISELFSNTINVNLLMRWVSPELFTDVFQLDTKSITVATFDTIVTEWFTSLCHQLHQQLTPILEKFVIPQEILSLQTQLRETLELKRVTESDHPRYPYQFHRLLNDFGQPFWEGLLQDLLLGMSLNVIRSFGGYHQSYRDEFMVLWKELIANDHLEIDATRILWDDTVTNLIGPDVETLKHHLDLRLSGQLPNIATVTNRVITSCSELELAYGTLTHGVDTPSGIRITQFTHELMLTIFTDWVRVLGEALDFTTSYELDLQLVRVLQALDKLVAKWEDSRHSLQQLISLSHEQEQQLSTIRSDIYHLVERGYARWQTSLSTEFIDSLRKDWLQTVTWQIPHEVPGHFLEEDPSELGPGYLPTQLSSCLTTILYQLSTQVFRTLGAIPHEMFVRRMLQATWAGIAADLESQLLARLPTEGNPFDAATLQYLFDCQFLHLLLTTTPSLDAPPASPLTLLTTHYHPATPAHHQLVTSLQELVPRQLTALATLLGGLIPTPPSRPPAPSYPFHNLLATAAPWQRLRLLDL